MFQRRVFQEGAEEEKQNGGWTVVRDNQMPEQPSTLETEVKADQTVERGLGPTDALVRAGNPHEFQSLTIRILKSDEHKADHQDQDKTIKLVKEWVREG